MPLKTHVDEQPSINLTPMIDIVFLLIIFFMLGTKFTEMSEAEKKLPLKVPEVSTSDTLTAAPRKRVINIYQDGTISLDREIVALSDLVPRLEAARQEYEALGVVIRGDAKSMFQNVASVLSAVRNAKITDVSVSVRVASNKQ